MIIGFDAKRALFNRSGLGNYSRSTLRLLAQFYPANEYFLYSPKDSGDLFQAYNNQKITTPDSGIYTLFPALWRSWGIQKEVAHHKLNIFHGLSNELPFGIQKTGVKTVVTIHDLIFLHFPEYYPFIDRKIYLHKFRHACEIADQIIATSEATKTDIMAFFRTDPKKIEVVYQTCDSSFRKWVSDTQKEVVKKKYQLPKKFILFLGTIEKRKNVLSLIKAYLGEDIDIPLVIAGKSTAYLDEIKAYIGQNPARGRILFRHNIKTEDLPAVYQSASLFVYPSVIEGFGIPILEALYSGVPVVTSTGSCFAETGGDAALYCDPYDYQQLGNLIVKVLKDKELSNSMIKTGYLHAAKFNEENVAANLMKVYRDLLKNS
jgi:glycosyltransferase involved in cell wall biosynthesis